MRYGYWKGLVFDVLAAEDEAVSVITVVAGALGGGE